MKPPASESQSPVPAHSGIAEVRYSLPDLLREVQLERSAAVFALEKLDRTEIAKIFEKSRPRRALKNSK
jgi:hypothetical protein